jgi:hypothetical protein
MDEKWNVLWLRCTVQLILYLEGIFPRMSGYLPTWSETPVCPK